jgi:hypothetical protein
MKLDLEEPRMAIWNGAGFSDPSGQTVTACQ